MSIHQIKFRAKYSLIFFILPFLAAGCQTAPYSTPLQVGGKKLNVEVMDTEKKLAAGLSGRERLSDNQGMIFLLPKTSRPSFWMKEMKFDLDLVWAKKNPDQPNTFTIVEITENVPAPQPKTSLSELPLYTPSGSVDAVLEVRSGWSKKNQIKISDEIKFLKP